MKTSVVLSPSFIAIAVAALGLMAATASAQAASANYTCSGGEKLTALFSPPDANGGRVKLTFGDGAVLVLPQQVSADGGRYAGGGVEFWIKGQGATLQRGAKVENCKTK